MKIKNNPLVSILIPLFNSEKYISETIESCLNQTCINIEIIIVDDGSTDNSYSVAEAYANKYDFIRLYKQENGGASKARNLAFKKSKGDFIQFLDADDILSENKIESQINQLKNSNSKIISYVKYGVFNENTDEVDNFTGGKWGSFRDPHSFYVNLISKGWIPIHCWLTPRNLIEESNGWNEDLIVRQDIDFFGKIIFLSKNGIFCNQGLAYYRQNSEHSITKAARSKKFYESDAKAYLSVLDYFNTSCDENYRIIYFKKIYSVYERLIYINSSFSDELSQIIQSAGYKNLKIFQSRFKRLMGITMTINFKFFLIESIERFKILKSIYLFIR